MVISVLCSSPAKMCRYTIFCFQSTVCFGDFMYIYFGNECVQFGGKRYYCYCFGLWAFVVSLLTHIYFFCVYFLLIPSFVMACNVFLLFITHFSHTDFFCFRNKLLFKFIQIYEFLIRNFFHFWEFRHRHRSHRYTSTHSLEWRIGVWLPDKGKHQQQKEEYPFFVVVMKSDYLFLLKVHTLVCKIC